MNNSEKHILIVENDAVTAHLLQRVLSRHGYRVTAAYDGVEGLAKACIHRPDLILLDIGMPRLNGYEVCYELNRHRETRGIAVLMLTARGNVDSEFIREEELAANMKDRLRGFEVGAADFLTKPVKADLLLQRVHTLLWSGT